jgi:Zn-dependent protease/CBS domain-containing protein/tetratricopeptide (TPR) repeat protein
MAPSKDGTPASRPGSPSASGFRLGRLAGVELRLDGSWFVLFFLILGTLAGALFPAYAPEASRWGRLLMGLAGAVLFLASLLLHELGHAVVANLRKLQVEVVSLFIFGGMARTRQEPRNPGDEFLVASAGPLVSLALALLFHGLAGQGLARGWPTEVTITAETLGYLNLLLAAFNLLPGFPLDGGRILRALLWWWTGSLRRSTAIAAGIGRILGWVVIGIGFWSVLSAAAFVAGLWMIFIGWFLAQSARSAHQNLLLREFMAPLTARVAMSPSPETVGPDLPVPTLVNEVFLKRPYNAFPVVDDGVLVGMVTLNTLRSLPRTEWAGRVAGEVMIPLKELTLVDPDTPMTEVLEQMQESEVRRILVVREWELLGLISSSDVARWLERGALLGVEEGSSSSVLAKGDGGGRGPRLGMGLFTVLPLLFILAGCLGSAVEAGAEPAEPPTVFLTEADDLLLSSLSQFLATARNERLPPASRKAATDSVNLILSRLGVVEDWRPLVRAELLAPLGDTMGVRLALAGLEPHDPLVMRWGWLDRVRAHRAAGDTVGARRAAEREGWRRGETAAAAPVWAEAGRLALALGDTAGARVAFGRALPFQTSVAGILDRILPSTVDPVLASQVGSALLDEGAEAQALRRLLPLFEGPRGGGGEGEVSLGLRTVGALASLDRQREAEALLRQLEPHPLADRGELLYLRGLLAYQNRQRDEAERHFLALAREHPTHPRSESGLLLLLGGAAERGGAGASPHLLEALLDLGPGAGAGELLAMQAGSRRVLEGDLQGALRHFDRMQAGATRPLPRQQGAYWAGLTLLRLGRVDEARTRFAQALGEDPVSLYGLLAGEHLDHPVLPGDLPMGPTPASVEAEVFARGILRLRIHRVLPTSGSFAFELDRLNREFLATGLGYDWAEALSVGGFPLESVVLGREIQRQEEGWNLRLLKIVFPFPHREVVIREAQARNLDPFFVVGLIRQESLFQTAVVSSAGAVGLMQLLPSTAREVAGTLGIRFEEARLSDPEVNVRLGTQFLATLLRRYDGRAEDALAAYNAGPGRMNQWRQRPEYRDREVFMEHVPFRETRLYIRAVQQNTRLYTALYGCGNFEPCLGDSYPAAVARSPHTSGAPGLYMAR